jgi:tetratricopeptide (TPR) repeat protein
MQFTMFNKLSDLKVKGFKNIATASAMMLASGSAFAQSDQSECLQNISLYREYFKQKNYDDAIVGWRYAFLNCPASTPSIKNAYINGPTIIGHFIDKNKDNAPVLKAYVDTLMMVYDKRIQLYPDDEAYALGRKGIDQYQYAGDDMSGAYTTLRKALTLGKNETESTAVLRLYQAAMKQLTDKKLEVETLFELYDEVSGVISFNLAKGEADKNYKFYLQAQEVVDQNFERIAQEDQYVQLMRPKVAASPSDAALLEKVANMMSKRKWTSNPFYLEVAESLYKINPSATAAYSMYEGYMKVDKSTEAMKYLEEAAKLEKDPATRAEYLLTQAKILGSKGAYSSARVKAQEAAGLKPSWGEPLIYIGGLYFSQSRACGSDACSQAYGYWAAEDMFIRAKSIDSSVAEEANKQISKVRGYFPSQKDCFFLGIQEGQTVSVGGWIGVDTKARFAN